MREELMDSARYFKMTGDAEGARLMAEIAMGLDKDDDFAKRLEKRNMRVLLGSCSEETREEFLRENPEYRDLL